MTSPTPITDAGLVEPTCPFCGCDPFEYVDVGVGPMMPVAVTCCGLGDQFYRGARPAPEQVTLSWEEFTEIGGKLHRLRTAEARARGLEAERDEALMLTEGCSSLQQMAATCIAGAASELRAEKAEAEVARLVAEVEQAEHTIGNQSDQIDTLLFRLDAEEGQATSWECRDYADGWIKFDTAAAAKTYQAETGALMRVTYMALPAGFVSIGAASRPDPAQRGQSSGQPAAERVWQPIDTAPEDNWVIIAVTGEHVGEAIMLIDQDSGEQAWTWADGAPVHDNHALLGWQMKPTPPAAGSPAGKEKG